jgi:hypothetical protein
MWFSFFGILCVGAYLILTTSLMGIEGLYSISKPLKKGGWGGLGNLFDFYLHSGCSVGGL